MEMLMASGTVVLEDGLTVVRVLMLIQLPLTVCCIFNHESENFLIIWHEKVDKCLHVKNTKLLSDVNIKSLYLCRVHQKIREVAGAPLGRQMLAASLRDSALQRKWKLGLECQRNRRQKRGQRKKRKSSTSSKGLSFNFTGNPESVSASSSLPSALR